MTKKNKQEQRIYNLFFLQTEKLPIKESFLFRNTLAYNEKRK